MWSVKDRALAESMDKDMVAPLTGQSNRGSLPLSFQPPMSRPPHIRSRSIRSVGTELGAVTATRQVSSNSVISVHSVGSDGGAVGDDEEAPMSQQDEEDELNLSSTLIFHTEYYLTYLRSKEEFKKANICPEEQRYLKFGRPDLKKIFADTQAMCEKDSISRVAVFVCGPSAMVNETVDLCRLSKLSPCSSVRFDCHHEVFDF